MGQSCAMLGMHRMLQQRLWSNSLQALQEKLQAFCNNLDRSWSLCTNAILSELELKTTGSGTSGFVSGVWDMPFSALFVVVVPSCVNTCSEPVSSTSEPDSILEEGYSGLLCQCKHSVCQGFLSVMGQALFSKVIMTPPFGEGWWWWLSLWVWEGLQKKPFSFKIYPDCS